MILTRFCRRHPCGLAALVAGLVLAGCVTNEAGRRTLMLISPGDEMQLGLSSFTQMKGQVPISQDRAANEMVRRVGERIKSVVKLPGAQWEFVVFESKEANAFCLPGGKIGVYTGILPIVKDDAGLATVLGHEIAHATLHHGGERMSQGLAINAFGKGLGVLIDSSKPQYTAAFTQLYGVGSQVGFVLPHSRDQESEADKMGLFYMARAGYDPEASVAFWERFAAYIKQAGGNSTPVWFSTHPGGEERIKQLKELIPQARAEAKAYSQSH